MDRIVGFRDSCRRFGVMALVLAAACFAQDVRLVGPGTPPTGGGGGGGGASYTLTMAPLTATLAVSNTVRLILTLRDAQGAPVAITNVTWTTSNSSVIVVDAAGLVRAMGLGTAVATASTQGVVANATITVVSTPVASVVVTPGISTLQLGTSQTFLAVTRDGAGNTLTGRAISWSTANAAVLTVDAGGVGRAVGTGTASVTATSEGQTGTATVTVQNIPVATVQVTPPSDTVQIGQQTQLAATPRDNVGNPLSGRQIVWSSSASGIARVSGNGLIDGLVAGTATITATSEGRSGTAAITVIPVPVVSVIVVPQAVTVQIGTTTTFNGTPRDANGNALPGRPISWASANTAIATVNATGVVSGIAPGTVLISGTVEGVVGSAFVTVTSTPATLVSVTILPQTVALQSGQTQQFSLTGTLSDASTVPVSGTFTAPGGSINGAGTYTAPDASGNFLVIGTANGTSLRDTATVTVTRPPVASVQVLPATSTIDVGQTLGLTATTRDAGGVVLTNRVVTWASSNTTVATVSSGGVVTARAVGGATITATSEGQSGTATITAQITPVASVSVAPSAATVEAGLTQQLTATTRDANGNILTGRVVTWTSSATGVATINGSGLLSALTAGSTTATATSEGRSGTATVTVVVSPVATVTVTPASASLNVAGTQQLTATPRSASGVALAGRVITWSSGNPVAAIVSGSGLVTAAAPGSATITATSEGRSGTSAITVNAPLPAGTWPNEPSGFNTVTDYGFGDVLPNPGPYVAVGSSGWQIHNPQSSNGFAERVSDASSPRSASFVGQWNYPVGYSGGGEPANLWHDVNGGNEIYIAFYWKPSSPFQSHSSGINKMCFQFFDAGGAIYMAWMNTNRIRLTTELTSESYRNLEPNVTQTNVTGGNWYLIEWYMNRSTGNVKWWVNGTLNGNYTVSFPGPSFGEFQFAPTWGGVGGSKSTNDWYRYDDIHISKR